MERCLEDEKGKRHKIRETQVRKTCQIIVTLQKRISTTWQLDGRNEVNFQRELLANTEDQFLAPPMGSVSVPAQIVSNGRAGSGQGNFIAGQHEETPAPSIGSYNAHINTYIQHNIPLEQHDQLGLILSRSRPWSQLRGQETHVHIDVLLPKRADTFGTDSIRMENIRAASRISRPPI